MAVEQWRVWIDTGGTFTDCIAVSSVDRVLRRKVLSSGRLQVTVLDSERLDCGRQQLLVSRVPGTQAGFFEKFVVGVPATDLEAPAATARVEHHGPSACGHDWLTLEQELDLGGAVELWNGFEAPLLGLHLLFGIKPGELLPNIELRLGTTRGTNALLERKGARCVLLVTRGFADLLEIGDQSRPELFAHEIRKPDPLYESVIEIDERVSAIGEILQPLAVHEQLCAALGGLRDRGIESAAVSLLHGYSSMKHETALAELLRASSIMVSVGSELSGLAGYLPRTQTAVVDAYLSPIFERYLTGIGDRIGQKFKVMSSAGGLVDAMSYRAKDSLLSGPAGGVMGCLEACKLAALDHALAFDMGGTSTDVSRISEDVEYDERHEVGGVTVMAPALAIRTVAAGGGSICRTTGGRITVGPESAGALPGPACYGRGGPLTVTDVNLLLGRIDGERFEVPLDVEASRAALVRELANVDSIESETLLEGFLQVANERMAETIAKVSTRRGFDPKDHALVAFGGAGGQHACDLAGLLGITRILVPDDCSLLSARGIGAAQVERIVQEQVLLDPEDSQLEVRIDTAAQAAVVLVAREADGGDGPVDENGSAMPQVSTTLNLRYVGQDSGLELDAEPLATLAERFVESYRAIFGYAMKREIEVEWLRTRARLPAHGLNQSQTQTESQTETQPKTRTETRTQAEAQIPAAGGIADAEGIGRTVLTWDGGARREVPLVDRHQVPWRGDGQVVGPALITEPYSSTWVATGWTAVREPRSLGLLLEQP